MVEYVNMMSPVNIQQMQKVKTMIMVSLLMSDAWWEEEEEEEEDDDDDDDDDDVCRYL